MSTVPLKEDVARSIRAAFSDHYPEEEISKSQVLLYATWLPLSSATVDADIGDCRQGDIVILVMDCGTFTLGRRVAAYALRKLAVRLVGRRLRHANFAAPDVYGIYPDTRDIRVVYHQNSAAARYTHSNLISVSRRRLTRSIQRLLIAVLGHSFQVDAVALIGKKQSC